MNTWKNLWISWLAIPHSWRQQLCLVMLLKVEGARASQSHRVCTAPGQGCQASRHDVSDTLQGRQHASRAPSRPGNRGSPSDSGPERAQALDSLTWVQIPVLPLIHHVPLGKWPNLFELLQWNRNTHFTGLPFLPFLGHLEFLPCSSNFQTVCTSRPSSSQTEYKAFLFQTGH